MLHPRENRKLLRRPVRTNLPWVRQARETLPPEEDAMRRISFYFLVLTVVGTPFSQESPDHQAPPCVLGRTDASAPEFWKKSL